MPGSRTDGAADARELRLAVVLYGGVSLAVYMHGTTKELHRLVKASALVEAGSEAARTPVERVYGDLLAWLAERDPQKVRTRVVVDVIAGTSAGGINGVYLAKAIARNRSQDALRDLWLTKGDIAQLLRGPRWLPPALKAPLLLAQAVKRPPLKGEAIARWMHDALVEMDAPAADGGALPTLLPPRHQLELFITTTDVAGYRRDLSISDPRLIHDHTHRHVFAFRHGDGDDDFAPADNAGLALAARSTMSFPGAFPPVSLRGFQDAVGPSADDMVRLRQKLFRPYAFSSADPERTHFIDGGVLDNRPFGHVIDAIRRRPAESEVDRRLLFLEPDPGQPEASPGSPAAPPAPAAKPPSPLATVLAAISGIPRKEPILDEILSVTRHNERVRRVRDIIEMAFAPIAERVTELAGGDLGRLADAPTAAELDAWRARISAAAREESGFAYATYIRSKVSGVVDRFARTICRLSDYPEDCNQAVFVRAVLREWARTRLYVERDGRPTPVDDQVAFLRTFDLDYGARRLRFVIDALSWWYRDAGTPGYPTRAQLDEGKRSLYELRDVLLRAGEGRGLGIDLTDEMLAVFARDPIDAWVAERGEGPEEYAREHAPALARLEAEFGAALNRTLDGFGERLFATVHGLTEGWSTERRADLLVRYLGFPYWDILLYPIQAVADAGERDAIDIVRMSPLDARLLPPLDPAKPKLAGVGIMHFGAFFDRAGRESDYLWGRLDGAERLIGLLLGTGAGGGAAADQADRERWCKAAFAAIVAEEEAALAKAGPLLEHVRRFAGG